MATQQPPTEPRKLVGGLIGTLAAKIGAALLPLILPKIIDVIPVVAAAVAKALLDQLREKLDLPLIGDVDVPELVDHGRDILNDLIPDIDIGNPMIDGWLDIWRPK